MHSGNLFSNTSSHQEREECFDTLLATPGVRIERIVSNGQASPPEFWYDQEDVEWVALL